MKTLDVIRHTSVKTIVALAFAALLHTAQAEVVADFEEDFRAQEPMAGWAYQWNPAGVKLGEHSRYAELSTPGGKHKLVVDPNSPPSKESTLPNAKWLQIRKGILSPGDPASLSTDDLDHDVIVSYTIQPGEEGAGSIASSSIKRKVDKEAGKISIYVNDRLIGSDKAIGQEESTFNVPLGDLKTGDTVYLAFGPGETCSIGATVQFQIDTKK